MPYSPVGLTLAHALKPKLSHVDFDAVAGLIPADLTAARVASRGSRRGTSMSLELDAAVINAKNRKPVYLQRDPTVRIVSRPNGLWRAERRVAERATREDDHWVPISHDTTKEAAIQRMLGITKSALQRSSRMAAPFNIK